MIETLSPQVRRILDEGAFCHVAASTSSGPHVTPMVFASAGGRLWVTTSRASVKARAWKTDPRVAGTVRLGDDAVAFTGRTTAYDLLDADTWRRSLVDSPLLALAGFRFTRKNARFFAGYAVDAQHVPLAWTPPGRVFAQIRLERAVLLEDGRVADAWGGWSDLAESVERFRVSRSGADPLASLPADVRGELGRSGSGALAVETPGGLVVLPATWAVDGAAVYAALTAETLGLAGAGPREPSSLCIDRPSSWRAREMVGAMVRGDGEVAVAGRLSSGGTSVSRIAGLSGLDAHDPAVVRLRPRSLVWWRGWSSGTQAVG